MKIQTKINVPYYIENYGIQNGKVYATLLDAGYAMNFNHLSFVYRLFEENESFISQSTVVLKDGDIDTYGYMIDSMVPVDFSNYTERQKIEYRFCLIMLLKMSELFNINVSDLEII